MLNLSDLAAQHTCVTKSKTGGSQKHKNIPIVVPITEPSFFAQALCANYPVSISKSHSKCSGRFSYSKQRSRVNRRVKAENVIVPFDFSTPSPDDIVKSKQKAAFSREPFRKCRNKASKLLYACAFVAAKYLLHRALLQFNAS
jgi:hypothetical protein